MAEPALTVGVFRILGNDLPPRHSAEQTFRNVKFMLDHEEVFENVSPVWCLNRIVDPVKLAELKELLANEQVIEIPFERDEYRKLSEWNDKIRYVTNVNGARNVCIDQGLANFDVVLPLDGAHFIRREGWYPFEEMLYDFPEEANYAIPCHRAETYDEIISGDFIPQIREQYEFGGGQKRTGIREPAIAFTSRADVRFNEELVYGKCNKAELLFRLGIPGVWEWWEPQIKEAALKKKSAFYGCTQIQGWTIRLPSKESGKSEGDNLNRGHQRSLGIKKLIQHCDAL